MPFIIENGDADFTILQMLFWQVYQLIALLALALSCTFRVPFTGGTCANPF